jgi:sugar/nucleoside kinase (ribokinase family)
VYDNPSHPASLLVPTININEDEYHLPIAEVYHLAIHPEHPPFDVIEALRKRPPPLSLGKGKRRRSVVSIETFTAADKAVEKDVLKRLLSLCDIFSPNEVEAASLIYGKDVATKLAASLSDEELIGPLIGGGEDGEDGDDVVVVVVRRGPRGAAAGWRNKYQDMKICSVPSYPDTKVLNVTGCGNSFLGAFLACYTDSNNREDEEEEEEEEEEEGLKEALCWGCAVGSIMAEEMSTPNGNDEGLRREAAYRAGVLLLKEREKNVRE